MNNSTTVALIGGIFLLGAAFISDGPDFLCSTSGLLCKPEPADPESIDQTPPSELESGDRQSILHVTDTLIVKGTVSDQIGIFINGKIEHSPWKDGIITGVNLASLLSPGVNRLTLVAINYDGNGSVDAQIITDSDPQLFKNSVQSAGFTATATYLLEYQP